MEEVLSLLIPSSSLASLGTPESQLPAQWVWSAMLHSLTVPLLQAFRSEKGTPLSPSLLRRIKALANIVKILISHFWSRRGSC